jgi:riboflavin kinase/FMN adenylyltransferase
VFDLDADLYGRWLCCDFVERLRDEEKFESIEALQAQMAQDCIRARTVLAAGPR